MSFRYIMSLLLCMPHAGFAGASAYEKVSIVKDDQGNLPAQGLSICVHHTIRYFISFGGAVKPESYIAAQDLELGFPDQSHIRTKYTYGSLAVASVIGAAGLYPVLSKFAGKYANLPMYLYGGIGVGASVFSLFGAYNAFMRNTENAVGKSAYEKQTDRAVRAALEVVIAIGKNEDDKFEPQITEKGQYLYSFSQHNLPECIANPDIVQYLAQRSTDRSAAFRRVEQETSNRCMYGGAAVALPFLSAAAYAYKQSTSKMASTAVSGLLH